MFRYWSLHITEAVVIYGYDLDNNIYVAILDYFVNHNYNKILKSDWLSTALISALIGQFNRKVRVMPK